MTIREATPEDSEALITMTQHFLEQTLYGALFGFHRESIAILVVTVIHVGVILIGEDAGVGVGMIAIAALDHPISGDKYAEELAWWVEPSHRHGTLGPRLLRSAERWCVQNDLNMLKMVAPHGSRVGAIYEHRGYRPIETAYVKKLN